MTTPADWQLPPGVSREVWDYVHDADLARRYDAELAGTPLLQRDLRFAIRHCPPGSRTLDLGCGTGRAAVPLALRGDRVTGIDFSEEMLRLAGAKATAAGVRLDRIKANIVELDCLGDEVFDNALCLFSTFGMVSGSDARRRVLGHAYRLLRPGGVLVLHVHNRWHNLRTRRGRAWLACDVGRALGGRGDAGDWLMEPAPGRTGWPIHLFTRREALGALASVGFSIVDVEAVGLGTDSCLTAPWWFGRLRAYGYLIAARKPK